jgi:hypothetical protein
VSDERVARFVEAVKHDPRVLGVARLRDERTQSVELLVVTTWDGGESLPAELPRLAGPLVGDGPQIEHPDGGCWTGVGADGWRARVELRRIGELVPANEGATASPVFDPHGFVEHWIRYSRNVPTLPACDSSQRPPVKLLLAVDSDMRLRQARALGASPEKARSMRLVRAALRPDGAAEEALARRVDDFLVAEPLAAQGARVSGGDDSAAAFESFLRVADDEGFKGDRVLFGEATKHLRDLSKRDPVFDQGFVVPTFDAVEAAFALGEAVGGCQPPLIPGVYVGVGVTPKDALEFWAAPFVRDPTCSVACVDDTGERDIVVRAAGRDPMVAALVAVIDAAWERLPALIDRARDAAKEQIDPAAVLAPLHLPKSFVERAKRRGAGALMCSRLTVALAVARAGHDCAPLAARKFGLAAGRVLAGL